MILFPLVKPLKNVSRKEKLLYLFFLLDYLKARSYFDEMFVPIKKYLTTDKQNVEVLSLFLIYFKNVVSVASKQTKEAKSNIKKAEAKSKKSSRDPTKLQQSIQELNKRVYSISFIF